MNVGACHFSGCSIFKTTGVFVGNTLVIKFQLVQNCVKQVGNRKRIFHSRVTHFISLAVDATTFVSGPYVPWSAQKNLVYNGDMEIGEPNVTTPPDGWAPNGNAIAGSSTDALPGGGLRSATLAKGTGGTAMLSQTISGLAPETDYVFDFWFKGPMVKVSMLNVRSKFVDRICFWEPYHDPQYPNPEHHWTHVTLSDYGPDPWIVTTPAGCNTITLGFTYGFAGENPIFLDNVSLSPLLPPAGNAQESE